MKYYFVLFNKQEGEKGNSYSFVTEDIYRTQIPQGHIKAYKTFEDTEVSRIPTKEWCKQMVLELGGTWYE